MPNYAIIENDTVANVTVADADFAASQGWVALTSGYGPGDLYNPTDGFSHPVEPVADRKARMKAALSARFRDARNAGTMVGGVLVSTTHDAAVELAEALAVIRSTYPVGTIDVVTRSGVPMTLTEATALAMQAAIRSHFRTCVENENAKATTLAAATTHDALDLIDITTGWPG